MELKSYIHNITSYRIKIYNQLIINYQTKNIMLSALKYRAALERRASLLSLPAAAWRTQAFARFSCV